MSSLLQKHTDKHPMDFIPKKTHVIVLNAHRFNKLIVLVMVTPKEFTLKYNMMATKGNPGPTLKDK